MIYDFVSRSLCIYSFRSIIIKRINILLHVKKTSLFLRNLQQQSDVIDAVEGTILISMRRRHVDTRVVVCISILRS